LEVESDIRAGIARKLEDVHQDLRLLSEQGRAQGFFDNIKNADKLAGLVEDIRDAVMDYQVCITDYSFLPCLTLVPDLIATGYLRQELPAHRESHLPAF